MSKPKIDSDGFQLVSSKNSSKKNSVVSHDKKFHKNDNKIDIEKSYRYSKYFFFINSSFFRLSSYLQRFEIYFQTNYIYR